jgi:hypothetical protein
LLLFVQVGDFPRHLRVCQFVLGALQIPGGGDLFEHLGRLLLEHIEHVPIGIRGRLLQVLDGVLLITRCLLHDITALLRFLAVSGENRHQRCHQD